MENGVEVAMERTILLVDDDENITSSLVRLLRRDGYSILRANSGQEGLAVLAQHKVGVIISDQRMPGMTGTEFLTKVRERYPDTVRVVLSGYTELNSVTDAINRGAVYKFLTKPWEDELLRANVDEAFQRHEMKIENARLARELQQANNALKQINLELEQRVERKAREIVHNLAALQVSQEMLEVMPVAALGIDNTGMIVAANQMARLLFAKNIETSSLLGEMAATIIPESLLSWASSRLHLRDEEARTFDIAGNDARCWCRSMGEFSRSNGVLLVIDAGIQPPSKER
ncbi:Hydrogenase transcriptional regulatory protein hupR1 [Ferriphaselus amnicola]|uniref:Hydrogenase transcriptional regulatory protein hupR1 n=2 Tax=Ferriphaselus amnicola TaxID=1188319 RepID=A0A2Z6GDI2_9PROT|nr:Hydrogenase transcriptional regulatory protein hupR1 [Ferriphaselus amnicola]